MSNADKIRKMDDEELLDLLYSFYTKNVPDAIKASTKKDLFAFELALSSWLMMESDSM